MLTPDLLRLIAASEGVVTRRQLRELGLSDQTIRRQVRAGVWRAEGRSALLAAGTAPTLSVRTRIVVANHRSVVPTGVSAFALSPGSAWQKQIAGVQQPWMIGPRDARGRWLAISHPGARLVRRGGLWTAADRTALIDLIRFLSPQQSVSVAMRAVQLGTLTHRHLRSAAACLVGYPGVPQLRAAIAAVSTGAASHGEARFIAILRRAGITGWVANHPVVLRGVRYVIDVAFIGARVALEFDGWAYHSDPATFARDRRRQNALVNAGWLVLRFTWGDLDTPDLVASQVLAALSERQSA